MELRLGGTLAAALASPHLTVTAMGSGGLAVPVGTGEMHARGTGDAGVRGVYALRTPPATRRRGTAVSRPVRRSPSWPSRRSLAPASLPDGHVGEILAGRSLDAAAARGLPADALPAAAAAGLAAQVLFLPVDADIYYSKATSEGSVPPGLRLHVAGRRRLYW